MPIDIHVSDRRRVVSKSLATRTLGRLLLLLACFQILQASLWAETRWPRFRGPRGTGQSTDDNV